MKLRTWTLLAAAACLLMLGLALFSYRAPGPLDTPKNLVFPRGTGMQGIATLLAEEGVVRSVLSFEVASVVTGAKGHFKAGEYAFPARISLRDVILMMVQGRVVIHKFTVPEGKTVREVVALMQKEPQLTGEPPLDIAEGSLLPETYNFSHGDSRATLIQRMQKDMKDALAAAWDSRDKDLPLATPEQALILASVVEKETGLAEERPLVAAVFENRLKKGIRLQSDPTAQYDLEQSRGQALGRALTLADLAAPTPHNTYMIDGLPPSPICNPGKASLQAVLHPAQSNALYFVATGTGGHHFAATLEEHNRNVEAYRAALRKQTAQPKTSVPKAPAGPR